MTFDYAKLFAYKKTPQSELIPGAAQAPNSAGGWAWPVDDWARLDRFLVVVVGVMHECRIGAVGQEQPHHVGFVEPGGQPEGCGADQFGRKIPIA